MCAAFADATRVTCAAVDGRVWYTTVHMHEGVKTIVLDKNDKTLNVFITNKVRGLQHTMYLNEISKLAQEETMRQAASIQSGGLFNLDLHVERKRRRAHACARRFTVDGKLPAFVEVELRAHPDIHVDAVKVRVVPVVERCKTECITMAIDSAAMDHIVTVLREQQRKPCRTRESQPCAKVYWSEQKSGVVAQNVHSKKLRVFKCTRDPACIAASRMTARAWATGADDGQHGEEVSDEEQDCDEQDRDHTGSESDA